MITCEAVIPRLGADVDDDVPFVDIVWDDIVIEWEPCGQPGAGRMTGGCIHEHIRTIVACRLHLEMVREIGCRRCFEAGHECQMLVRAVPA